MENAYGIGVKNRYELFYDEDVDPLEILKHQEEEKEKRKTDKAQCKDKTKIIKTGKPVSSTGLPKKAKESTPATIIKPVEITESTPKPRSKPFTDRTAKSMANDDSKENEDRKNIRNRDDQQFNPDSRERDGEFKRGGRGGGFRGRGRGSRGRGVFFNNYEGRNRREFDRHSGSDKTGVRHVDKREGAGMNNWGDIKGDLSRRKEAGSTWNEDEFDVSGDKANESVNWGETSQDNEMSTCVQDEIAEKTGDEAIIDNSESKENEPVTDEKTEEGAKEMTLDEWKREQQSKRAVPKYNLRKPGEGEDGNQWKKLYVLKKKAKEDDDEEEEEEEDVDDDEFARRGRHRQLVDIPINFNDSRRGRGRGRGGRGGTGPRGGGATTPGEVRPTGNRDRDRDAPREERTREIGSGASVGSNRGIGRGPIKMSKAGQQSAPRVDDWNDFPSLVTA